MFDNVDNLALAFFTSLVACSILSDSYIVANNFLKNNYIKKRLSYIKKIYKVINAVVRNNYKKDDNGNIVLDEVKVETEDVELVPEEIETNIASTNPFDQDGEKDQPVVLQQINKIDNNNTVNHTEPLKESIPEVDLSHAKPDKSKKKNKTVIKEIILKSQVKKNDCLN
jgi:hypothetical protein